MTVGTDDLVIRVRLDTVQAKQEIEKQDKAAKQLGSSMGFGMTNLALKGTAGALAMIFGQSAQQSMSNLTNITSNIGRSTMFGQQIERDTAKLSAMDRARAQTADMFGFAGNRADPNQILSVYRALLQMENLEGKGRQRVQGVIDRDRARDDIMAVGWALDNLGSVLKEFMNLFKSGRPEIR